MLGRPLFMMGVLNGNAHLLQRQNRVAAQIGAVVQCGQIERAAAVQRLRTVLVAEIEVLDFGTNI